MKTIRALDQRLSCRNADACPSRSLAKVATCATKPGPFLFVMLLAVRICVCQARCLTDRPGDLCLVGFE